MTHTIDHASGKPKPSKNLIYFIIIAVFFDVFVHLPVISPFAASLGAGIFMIGIIVAAYSISNMAGNFLAGPLIDRYGRKLPIMLGTFSAAIFVFLYSLAATPGMFTFFRILHGLAVAFVTPAAFTFLGDETESGQRGKAMAKSGFAISLPALIGPPLGGTITANFGPEYVFYLVSAIMLAISLLTYFVLREPDKPAADKNSRAILLLLLKNRGLKVVYMAAFALMYAKGVLMYMLPLHVEKLGYTSADTGILFGSFALSAIILFLLPVNISDKIGRLRPLLAGLILIAFSVGSLNFFTSIIPLTIIMLIYGTGFGLLFPSMTALLVDMTSPETRGAAFGIFYGLFSAGVILGPISTGFLTRFNISPFLAAGVFVLVFVGIILRFSEQKGALT